MNKYSPAAGLSAAVYGQGYFVLSLYKQMRPVFLYIDNEERLVFSKM